MNITNKQ